MSTKPKTPVKRTVPATSGTEAELSISTTAGANVKRILDESMRKNLEEYKEKLAQANARIDFLEKQVHQQEVDALEVIASLKLENEKVSSIKTGLEAQKKLEMELHREELRVLQDQLKRTEKDDQTIIDSKNQKISSMEKEIAEMKSFQTSRDEMLENMARQKFELVEKERKYQERIANIEKRAFEEKLKIQKDANQRAKEMVIKAHQEAVQNLDRTTRNVYAENLRMAEALQNHINQTTVLRKSNEEMAEVNRRLLEEKHMHSVIIKEKIVQTKVQTNEIRELQEKISTLEYSLTHVVRVFEQERDSIAKMAKKELDYLKQTTEGLRVTLKKKSQEMRHIRRLALHILYQRTDLERFFMDSLEHVRNEIRRNDVIERRKRQQKHFLSIAEGLNENDSQKHQETSSSGKSHEHRSDKVDIGDIPWKEKERVLRLLFAKMNGLIGDQKKGLTQHQRQDLALSVALKSKEMDKRAVEDAINIDAKDLV